MNSTPTRRLVPSARFATRLALLCLITLAPAAAKAQATSYTLTDLGNFGTDSTGYSISSAFSINNAGQVVGLSNVYDANHNSAGYAGFLYSNGQLQDIGHIGTDHSGRAFVVGFSINNGGQAVGFSSIYDSQHNPQGESAVLYSGGKLTDLKINDLGHFGTGTNGLYRNIATGINGKGDIIGQATLYDANHQVAGQEAFLYSGGKLTDLGSLGTNSQGYGNSFAAAVNNNEQIVGSSGLYDSSHNLLGTGAFLYSGGKMTGLGNFGSDAGGYSDSQANALNDAGTVVGYSEMYDSAHHDLGRRAFVFSNGQLQNIGTFGTDAAAGGYGVGDSAANGINSLGQVVGGSEVYDAQGNAQGNDAFLFSHGVMTDISKLVSNRGGWSNLVATGINDQGQIIGDGVLNGNQEAFLLNPSTSPVPEASSAVSLGLLLMLGLGGTVVSRRRKTAA